MAIRHCESQQEHYPRSRMESRTIGLQVDMPEKNVLNRSSFMNIAQERNDSGSKLLPKKGGLCVVGQKMEDDLTLMGQSVGVQVDFTRIFLKHRKELQFNQSLPKRVKPTMKVGIPIFLNENNLLGGTSSLHTTMRIFNKRS